MMCSKPRYYALPAQLSSDIVWPVFGGFGVGVFFVQVLAAVVLYETSLQVRVAFTIALGMLLFVCAVQWWVLSRAIFREAWPKLKKSAARGASLMFILGVLVSGGYSVLRLSALPSLMQSVGTTAVSAGAIDCGLLIFAGAFWIGKVWVARKLNAF